MGPRTQEAATRAATVIAGVPQGNRNGMLYGQMQKHGALLNLTQNRGETRKTNIGSPRVSMTAVQRLTGSKVTQHLSASTTTGPYGEREASLLRLGLRDAASIADVRARAMDRNLCTSIPSYL